MQMSDTFLLSRNSLRARFTFSIKLAAAFLLVALADALFFEKELGSTVGIFACAWVVLLPLASVPVRHSRPALVALALAAVAAMALADEPSLLAWVLFWTAISSAALLALRPSADAAQHAARLVIHGLQALRALRDIVRPIRLPRPGLRGSLTSLAGTLLLPVIGGVLFTWLFAIANPVVAGWMPSLALAWPDGVDLLRPLFWGMVFMILWPSFRPRHSSLAPDWALADIPAWLPNARLASVAISLLLFNGLFGVENLLDIAFLWSGARLPAGVSMADYAHRGAYPLIVTALLAGAFVLATARPDTEIGRNRVIRRLVTVWIVQNLILVASSVIRTMDYINAYMLTTLRLAALGWMALVAASLILICWRMLTGRSLAWLVNAVVACTLLLLFGCTVLDLGSLTARWNARHAREVGGTGQPLDLGYLRQLGPSALVALARLEAQPLSPVFRERVSFIRRDIQGDMEKSQQVNFGWTWRSARRLGTAGAILAGAAPVIVREGERTWDGWLVPPPPPPVPPVITFPEKGPVLPAVPGQHL